MKIITNIEETQKTIAHFKSEGKTIVVVPTMGFLHEGHISLIRIAKAKGEIVVATLFVNPKQFGPSEDFSRYPRDLQRDSKMLEDSGCDILFAPDSSEMYDENFSTKVTLSGITEIYEGKTRPTHYDGVALVVLKLFNITKADIAIFGQKDYQQFMVIKRMVIDLNFDIKLIMAPIIREENGLAMSSRNKYLNTDEFQESAIIFHSLKKGADAIKNGIRKSDEINKIVINSLEKSKLIKIDYVATLFHETFLPAISFSSSDRIVILIACWIGSTRLIDNMIIDV